MSDATPSPRSAGTSTGIEKWVATFAMFGIVFLNAIGYLNQDDPAYRTHFGWLSYVAMQMLTTLVVALVFSDVRLHYVRHRKRQLLPRWLLTISALVLLVGLPYVIVGISTISRALAHAPGQSVPVGLALFNLLLANLPGVAWGVLLGTLCRRRWYPLALGVVLTSAVVYVLITIPGKLIMAMLLFTQQGGTNFSWLSPGALELHILHYMLVLSLLLGAAWKYALWNQSVIQAARISMQGVSTVLLRKEIRLQRNNLYLTLGALLVTGFSVGCTYLFPLSLAGFSPQDVRGAIISCLTVPAFVLVLPAMIGSTAAASERALDVWRWQAALPVHWRTVMRTKLTIMAALVFIIAGLLPYVASISFNESEALLWMFRGSWTLWCGILCCAIGFFSGSVSRDDYQGLMVSAGVITYFVLISFLADPEGLVFPAYLGAQFALNNGVWLVLRLSIMSALLICAGSYLMRLHGVNWKRMFTLFALIVSPLVFAVTLYHLRQDRSLLVSDWVRKISVEKFTTPTNLEMTSGTIFLHPKYIASVKSDDAFGGGAQIMNRMFMRSLDRHDSINFVSKGEVGNYFNTSPSGVTEYYQTVLPDVVDVSPGKRWILMGDNIGNSSLCGPYGISVHSRLLTHNTVKFVSKLVGITGDHHEPPELLAVGLNDVVLDAGARGSIVWQDALDYITSDSSKRLKYTPESLGSADASGFSSNIVIVALDDNDGSSSRTFGLVSVDGSNRFVLGRGYTGPEMTDYFRRPNLDLPWFIKRSESGSHYTVAQMRFGFSLDEATTTPGSHWNIQIKVQASDGSSVKVHPSIQIISKGENQYAFFPFSREKTVWLSDVFPNEVIPIGYGVLVFDLKTGTEQYVDFPSLTHSSTEELIADYKVAVENVVNSSFEPGSAVENSLPVILVSRDGVVLAVSSNGNLHIICPDGSVWADDHVRRYASYYSPPGSPRFKTDDVIEIINGNSIQILDLALLSN